MAAVDGGGPLFNSIQFITTNPLVVIRVPVQERQSRLLHNDTQESVKVYILPKPEPLPPVHDLNLLRHRRRELRNNPDWIQPDEVSDAQVIDTTYENALEDVSWRRFYVRGYSFYYAREVPGKCRECWYYYCRNIADGRGKGAQMESIKRLIAYLEEANKLPHEAPYFRVPPTIGGLPLCPTKISSFRFSPDSLESIFSIHETPDFGLYAVNFAARDANFGAVEFQDQWCSFTFGWNYNQLQSQIQPNLPKNPHDRHDPHGQPGDEESEAQPDEQQPLSGQPDAQRLGGQPDAQQLGGQPDAQQLGGQQGAQLQRPSVAEFGPGFFHVEAINDDQRLVVRWRIPDIDFVFVAKYHPQFGYALQSLDTLNRLLAWSEARNMTYPN